MQGPDPGAGQEEDQAGDPGPLKREGGRSLQADGGQGAERDSADQTEQVGGDVGPFARGSQHREQLSLIHI